MPFPSPRPSRYAIKARRGSSGLGLFALGDIPRGRFIVEYVGPVVSDEKAERIAGRYLFDLGDGTTIDGSSRRNIARYANHACMWNAETRQHGKRVYIFSTKKILAGEEITYDYGKSYFDAFIKPYGCRCAAHRATKTRAV